MNPAKTMKSRQFAYVTFCTFSALQLALADFLPEVPDAHAGSDWVEDEFLELPEYIPRSET